AGARLKPGKILNRRSRSPWNTATRPSSSAKQSARWSLSAMCPGQCSMRFIVFMAANPISDAAQPRIAKGVRLQVDSATGKTALLAEVTYSCPLHCPYCSNPTDYCRGTATVADPESARRSGRLTTAHDGELTTDQWKRVIREAAALGVLQIGFSGGEPLARRDL